LALHNDLYMKNLLLIATTAILFSACQADGIEPINPNDKNNLTIEFDNIVGSQNLAIETTQFINASGEDYTITNLNYFISNISLKKTDGTSVSMADQYFLVKETDQASLTPSLKNVPAGDYTSMTFTIGVDSLKSISAVDQRTGCLDPASYGTDNMYWSWNSGYIFFKMEGISSKAPVNSAGLNKFQYHIGGFGGRTSATANNLRKVTVNLPSTVTVRKSIAPSIHFLVDINGVFGTNVKIANGAVIMNPAISGPIANNYQNIFKVDHVHN
jgi:hypothetical protein